jgi:hypothetical protein
MVITSQTQSCIQTQKSNKGDDNSLELRLLVKIERQSQERVFVLFISVSEEHLRPKYQKLNTL